MTVARPAWIGSPAPPALIRAAMTRIVPPGPTLPGSDNAGTTWLFQRAAQV